MAKQRYINTSFWDDSYISELESLEKLLFLYLLTTPLTDIAGVYKITLKRIAFDTGIENEQIQIILKKFEANNKIIYKDGWMLICNFIKHQAKNPKVVAGINRSLANCPAWIIDKLSIAYDNLFNLNSNLNSDLNSDFTPSNDGQKIANASPIACDYISQQLRVESKSKKPKEVDERAAHPAIKLVHSIVTRYPHKDLWDRIIREIGDDPDSEFFRASYELWRSVNGNPMNLEKWLFMPNKTGKVPEIYGKENSNGKYQQNTTIKSTAATIIKNRPYRNQR